MTDDQGSRPARDSGPRILLSLSSAPSSDEDASLLRSLPRLVGTLILCPPCLADVQDLVDKPFDDPFQHAYTFFILANHSGDGGTILSIIDQASWTLQSISATTLSTISLDASSRHLDFPSRGGSPHASGTLLVPVWKGSRGDAVSCYFAEEAKTPPPSQTEPIDRLSIPPSRGSGSSSSSFRNSSLSRESPVIFFLRSRSSLAIVSVFETSQGSSTPIAGSAMVAL